MKNHIVGLTLGTLLAGIHLLWSILVALGWGQPFSDWLHKIHFINSLPQISPFDLGTAALLVVVTFFVGFVIGNVFTMLWKHFSK